MFLLPFIVVLRGYFGKKHLPLEQQKCYFGVFRQKELTMRYKLFLFSAFFIFVFCSCGSEDADVKNVQHSLLQQQKKADNLAAYATGILTGNEPDSITSLLHMDRKGTIFYVFSGSRLIFWSDNWLAANEVSVYPFGKWFYQLFENAHCICRWNKAGTYNLLTIIPIKYNYPFENKQLNNNFLPPFKLRNEWDIICDTNHSNPIYGPDNEYLFSLCEHAGHRKNAGSQIRIAESFSYSELLVSGNTQGYTRNLSQMKVRIYFILCVLLFTCGFISVAYIIYKKRGFRNLKLGQKFGFAFIILLMLSFVCVFFASINYVRKSYETKQRADLQRKTFYIQKALQEMYYWNQSLSLNNTTSLNIDLQDLSYTYETDIHVYDINGMVVGSSMPTLFRRGLLGRRMAPSPYFAQETIMTQQEQVGNLQYLSAYTDFYNGDYVQIGYIAVPLFISANEIAAEVDSLLAKLLPIYISVLLLAGLLTMIIGRQITAPINTLQNRLKHMRIGQFNEKMTYKPHDEISHLVTQYNLMVDELEKSAQLLAKSERENAWKTMARQIAHEINNPLTPMKLTIQQLQRTKSMDAETFDNYFKKSTALLIEQIDNLSRIAGLFSQFAKMPEMHLQPVNIAAKLNSVATLFENNTDGIQISCTGTDNDLYATTDDEQIMQVLNNLLKNAMQALAGRSDGRIDIRLTQADGMVRIDIADNGPGISDDIRDKIFVPNFTTKSTGMGLGLAISKNIVETSGGSITFTSESSKGTTFTVTLPAS